MPNKDLNLGNEGSRVAGGGRAHSCHGGKNLLQVDPKEKETDPRVVERLAPVVSEPLDASAAP